MASVGQFLGPYKLLESLGRGGMGDVFLAERTDPVYQKVAVKVLRDLTSSDELLKRFELERQALALMSHPNVARVTDAGATADGAPYFVMELVRGLPLDEYCRKHKLRLRPRLELFVQVCRGVQHAHHKGLIHRDLKPGNILVSVSDTDDRPVAKIIDFGLARATDQMLATFNVHTEHGRSLGTFEYMSPEQAEAGHEDIDQRTDIYSLGVVLYELLTGTLPFDSRTFEGAGLKGIRDVLRERQPVLPSSRLRETTRHSGAKTESDAMPVHERRLRGDLDWVVMKCLEKERTRRYDGPGALADDIERFLRGEDVLAGRPSRWDRLVRSVRRNRVPLAVAALVFATMAVALVMIADSRAQTQLALENLTLRRDRDLVEQLRGRYGHLLPVSPHTLAEAQSWLADAAALAAEDRLERMLAEQRPVMARLASELEVLRREVLEGDGSQLGRMAVETRRVRTEIERLARENAGAWAGVAERVAAHPLYQRRGPFTIAEQSDLVPLGPDPESTLEEFAVAFTGSVPERDGALRLAEDCAVVLVLVPPGAAFVGASARDPDALPVERPGSGGVELDAYLLGKYELTRSQYRVMSGRDDPSKHGSKSTPPAHMFEKPQLITGRSPVEMASLEDLTEVLGRFGLGLPNEAQWEYACRAGTSTTWWTGDDRAALDDPPLVNINDETLGKAGGQFPGRDYWPSYDDGYIFYVPVGTLPANPWGFHEILGNVKELCDEPWHDDHAEGHRSGDGAHRGEPDLPFQRAARGGSWQNSILEARPSARRSIAINSPYDNVGCRPMRSLPRD